MKKKLLVIAAAVIMALMCVVGFVACGGDDGIDGTYYSYADGERREDWSMKLKDKKVTITYGDKNGPKTAYGTYKVDGKELTMVLSEDGGDITYTFTVVSDGVLKLLNEPAYFCKDGKTPPAKNEAEE